MILFISSSSFAQDTSKVELNLGTDFVSRYVWRGTDYGRSPSIQPYMSATFGKFELGAWGAFTTNGLNIQETDLYLTYSISDAFSVTLFDYFFPDDALTMNNYFEYTNDKTGHIEELVVSFNGTKKIPLNLSIGTIIYGADKVNYYSLDEPDNTDLNFSTYIELGYSGSIGNGTFNTFVGFTTHTGLYGEGFNVVNVGITGNKDVKLTEYFSLPLSCSIIFNPQKQNVFLVFGISI